MKLHIALFVSFVWLLLSADVMWAQGSFLRTSESMKDLESFKVTHESGMMYGDLESGVHFNGTIHAVTDQQMEVHAHGAFWDFKDQSISLNDDVVIYSMGHMQRAKQSTYSYQEKLLDMRQMRGTFDEGIIKAEHFYTATSNGKSYYVGENAFASTDDVDKPEFWIRSKRIAIYPNDKILFKDFQIYLWDTPIFWLPYLYRSLNPELGYHYNVGSRSTWGPFLQNRYGIMLGGKRDPVSYEYEDAWGLLRLRADVLSKRGLATGFDLVDYRDQEKGLYPGFSIYGLADQDPLKTRNGIPRSLIDDKRYMMKLEQRYFFDNQSDSEWKLDFNLFYLNDRYFLEDYRSDFYRSNPEPDNMIGLSRTTEKTLAQLTVRPRVNDFYRTNERLPELSYDVAKTALPKTKWLYESKTSFANLRSRPSLHNQEEVILPLLAKPAHESVAGYTNQLSGYERLVANQYRNTLAENPNDPSLDNLRAELLDAHFARLSSYHEFSNPFTLAQFFAFNPKVGVGFGGYRGVSGSSSELNKGYVFLGNDASFKIVHDYSDVKWRLFGLNGLLHVIEPYTSWSFIEVNSSQDEVPKIDHSTFTTRPRTLSLMRFNALEDIEPWNVIRVGVKHYWFTNRNDSKHSWLTLNSYIDQYINDPELDRNYSNFYNDLVWVPLPWLAVNLETQVPVFDKSSKFKEINSYVKVMPNPNMTLALGYRILNNHPYLPDSNRWDINLYWRLNSTWGVGLRHVYELDDNVLEFEQYTLYRDLGHWIGSLQFSKNNNRLDHEYEFLIGFNLKDIPDVEVPFSLNL